jgi:hypothetical protein
MKSKIDHDMTIRSAMTSSIEWNWCKTSSGLPSSCRDEKLTICRAKKWSFLISGVKNDAIFHATVEIAARSSTD